MEVLPVTICSIFSTPSCKKILMKSKQQRIRSIYIAYSTPGLHRLQSIAIYVQKTREEIMNKKNSFNSVDEFYAIIDLHVIQMFIFKSDYGCLQSSKSLEE